MTTTPRAAPRSRVIAGRLVKHTLGARTQTFAVSTPAKQVGDYEVVYRFPRHVDLALADVPDHPDVAGLRAWFEEQCGDPELPGSTPGSGLPDLVHLPDGQDDWLVEARHAVDRAMTRLVDGFLRDPYLHRVEHSLHAELFALLQRERVLAGTYRLADGTRTQLIHKEWPETVPRPSTGDTPSSRGLFDLVVLNPAQLARASLRQFRTGRVAAPLVIEAGLDYGLPHLLHDVEKLRNSEVRAGYLLHLSRLPVTQPAAVEEVLAPLVGDVRAAYVQHTRQGVRVKHLHEGRVREVVVPQQGQGA